MTFTVSTHALSLIVPSEQRRPQHLKLPDATTVLGDRQRDDGVRVHGSGNSAEAGNGEPKGESADQPRNWNRDIIVARMTTPPPTIHCIPVNRLCMSSNRLFTSSNRLSTASNRLSAPGQVFEPLVDRLEPRDYELALKLEIILDPADALHELRPITTGAATSASHPFRWSFTYVPICASWELPSGCRGNSGYSVVRSDSSSRRRSAWKASWSIPVASLMTDHSIPARKKLSIVPS